MTAQQAVARHGYGIVLALLLLGIIVLSGFLLLVAMPDLIGSMAVVGPTPTPTASPSASPSSAMALSPIGIEMPADSDCAACHVTTSGTVGTRPIPQLAHPLWGFRDCTACHSNDSLVKTAPGHSGLHRDQCLVCHNGPEFKYLFQSPGASAEPSAAPSPAASPGATPAADTGVQYRLSIRP